MAEVNERRRLVEKRLRGYAFVRWYLGRHGIDPDDFAAVKTFAETETNKKSYFEQQVPAYLKGWAHRVDLAAEVTALEKEAMRLRVPVSRKYEIRPSR